MDKLPDDILVLLLSHLNIDDFLNLRAVNRCFYDLSKEHERVITKRVARNTFPSQTRILLPPTNGDSYLDLAWLKRLRYTQLSAFLLECALEDPIPADDPQGDDLRAMLTTGWQMLARLVPPGQPEIPPPPPPGLHGWAQIGLTELTASVWGWNSIGGTTASLWGGGNDPVTKGYLHPPLKWSPWSLDLTLRDHAELRSSASAQAALDITVRHKMVIQHCSLWELVGLNALLRCFFRQAIPSSYFNNCAEMAFTDPRTATQSYAKALALQKGPQYFWRAWIQGKECLADLVAAAPAALADRAWIRLQEGILVDLAETVRERCQAYLDFRGWSPFDPCPPPKIAIDAELRRHGIKYDCKILSPNRVISVCQQIARARKAMAEKGKSLPQPSLWRRGFRTVKWRKGYFKGVELKILG